MRKIGKDKLQARRALLFLFYKEGGGKGGEKGGGEADSLLRG